MKRILATESKQEISPFNPLLGRYEAALEQLISLGATCQSNQPTGGRPSTPWSPIPESEYLAEEESHNESTAEETANEKSMQEQT
jgi:hypothetical protein